MQFHLNGFHAGDPEQQQSHVYNDASSNIPSKVDVLVIGAGPAGLALAAQLSQFSDITTRIVEQKHEKLTLGQADGLQCRSLEMFEAFGFSERVLKEGYWVNETTFWKPDEDRTRIARSGRIRDTEEGLSEFPHIILNQARVHDFFLDVMRKSPTGLSPDYSRRIIDLKVQRDVSSDSPADYPVEVKLERLDDGHQGEHEIIRARYVVGCEGARSKVRDSLRLSMNGDFANQAWGVMDILAVTNFPDFRTKAAVHSANEGSILLIPREGGYLVRLYIELDKLKSDERVSNKNITADHLIGVAQRILHPYELDVKEVAWWSVYEIGQRLCSQFDDTTSNTPGQHLPRVFIAGDACHTHSPKAGQGMNVSMQDGFNLGWKLASVLSGVSSPEILRTYSTERHAVAKELIDFDREFARMFSARPKRSDSFSVAAGGPKDVSKQATDDETKEVDPAEFQKYFQRQARFTAGLATRYTHSLITGDPRHQHLAKGFEIGTRFHSAQVIRLADAKPMHLGHTVKADGRWRIFIFGAFGDPTAQNSSLSALCRFLSSSVVSPLNKYTPKGADVDSIFDLRAVVQQNHASLSLDGLPDILWPRKGKYGLRDYEKIYCAEKADGCQEDIFDCRGIDREQGCVVLVRPDQYVAHVLPLDAHDELADFFDAFMIAV